MSVSTGTRKERNVQTRTNEAIIEGDKAFIDELKRFTESSNSVAGLAGSSINNSPKTPAGNYLARPGDSMLGPLALNPPVDFTVEVDANNTIDIGPSNENPQYSSNIQLDDLQPNSSVLDIIANAAFDGQLLILRTFAPTVAYTISQGTIGNGGNIQTGNSNDIVVGDLQTVVLIFDAALIINANTGGTWRVVSVSTPAGGGGAADWSLFPALQPVNMAGFSFTNYVGWTADVGQGMDVGANGDTWNLPANDVYLWRINGADQFQIAEATINVFNNTITEYIGWTAAVGQGSVVDTSGVTSNLPAGDTYTYRINGADQFEILENQINVHDHSLTNFVGYTAGVGQGLTVDGTGNIYDLGVGDQYNFRINGTSEFVVADGASAFNSPLSMNNNSVDIGESFIEFADVTDASIATPAAGERRLYYSSDEDALSVKDSSGTVHNLETGGGPSNIISQGNSNVTVTDVGTGAISFTVDGISQGSLTNAIGWSLDNDVFINSSHTLTVDGISTFNDQINLDTRGVITVDNDGLILRAPVVGDSVEIQTEGANARARFELNSIVFFEAFEINDPMTIDGGNYIAAHDSTEAGYFVTNATSGPGDRGSLQMPVETGSIPGTVAAIDTNFGSELGCHGIYLNNGGNPTIVVKIDTAPNTWAAMTIPTSGNVLASHLT